jgi:ABC-type polysaccharide/polyol phosphate export permease
MATMKTSGDLRRAMHLLDVIAMMVQRDFRGRYKHTSVGLLWSVLNPLMFLIIFYFVFDVVLAVGIPHYSPFIFIGILVWQWTQSALVQATSCISGNPGLVGQPGFPVAALPIVATIGTMVNFLIALPLLVGLILWEGVPLTPWAILTVPLIALQALVIASLSYGVAALNVRWRDIEHALPIVLQLGYFITPIFYDASRLPPHFRPALYWNPFAWIVDSDRAILLYGAAPDPVPLMVIAVGAVLLLAISTGHFMRARSLFLEEL